MKGVMCNAGCVLALALVGLVGCGLASQGGEEAPVTAQTDQAIGTYEFEYEYYSDATYTQSVGERNGNCQNARSGWGVKTRFIIGVRQSCNNDVVTGCREELFDGSTVCSYASCVDCYP